MKNKLSQLSSGLLIGVFVLSSFGPVTAVPSVIATETLQAPPNLQVQSEPVGPTIVGQAPPAGQRLELSLAIEFIFDRDMDQTKTAQAFTLLDSDNKPVPGKVVWLTPKTFSFKPNSPLIASTVYQAIFTTSAIAVDGKPLATC